MLSVCCNAKPVGLGSYDELEGSCSKCGKPTGFYREDKDINKMEKDLVNIVSEVNTNTKEILMSIRNQGISFNGGVR
jgi:transcription initiation factor IIE alpha subunit